MTSSPTVDELEQLRAPLLGYCYRLLGSAHDAEDAVQETLLKAVNALSQFDPDRGRLSTWVHRIATNVCLDMLRSAKRRALVPTVPHPDPTQVVGESVSRESWIEPMPTSRVELVGDPVDRVIARESVRLAFLAALQHLPPRQRAVLLLRDVLGYSAKETAIVLDITVPATTSALQRARATLSSLPAAEALPQPDDLPTRRLLDRYVAAFEAHDYDALVSVLHEDAASAMPPFSWLVCGRANIAALMAASDACAGARLVPCSLNGAPGFGQYRPDGGGRLVPFALVAVEVQKGLISTVVTFLESAHRFAEFGLPPVLDGPASPSTDE